MGLVQHRSASVQKRPMGRSARSPAGADVSAELLHQSHEIIPLDIGTGRPFKDPAQGSAVTASERHESDGGIL
jgi:hypothetical protein